MSAQPSKGQCRSSKICLPLVLVIKAAQNIFFPETYNATTFLSQDSRSLFGEEWLMVINQNCLFFQTIKLKVFNCNECKQCFNTKFDLRVHMTKAHLKIWYSILKNPHTNISIKLWQNLFKYPNKTSFDSNWCYRRHDINDFFKFLLNFFSEWIPTVANN